MVVQQKKLYYLLGKRTIPHPLQILFGVGSDPPVYSTKLFHYKFTSGWDPPLSNKISLRGGIQCK